MKDNNNSGDKSQQPQPSGKMGVIYKITCTLNGKSYVGQTRQKLGRRITEHKRDSNRDRPGIDHAIHVHGWKNFTVEVLETCPVEKMDERERHFIKLLGTKAPNGYNLTDGGDGGRGCSPSAETRAKLSAKLKGRPAHNKGVKHTAEARAKMSAAHKASGNRPPDHTGKKRSPETLAKMSAAAKAAWAKKKLESQNKS